MISLLGHYLLSVVILSNLILLFLRRYNYINYLLAVQSLCIFFSLASLGIIYLQYEQYTIASYSIISIIMSSFFRVGSIWSSHEGSMLLWCSILIIYQQINFIYAQYSASEQYRYIKCTSIINCFFLIYTFTTSNPFISNYLMCLHDSELNPILQDPILIIHPPIIYFGYLSGSILFINALLIIYSSNIYILNYIRIYSILSMSFLTIGITLGSWWAYHELGWGGWWFWDPVENVSLLPWIMYIIIIHNIILSIKKNVIDRWTINCCLVSFLFSCYGTFFVRSGFVTSVHSFISDDTKGIILLSSISALIMLAIYIYVNNNNIMSNIDSILLYIYNNIHILLVIIISISLVFPYIYFKMTSNEISIGSTFYNDMLLPLLIPLLILMYYGLNYGFHIKKEYIIYISIYIFIVTLVYIYYYKYRNISILSSCIYAILVSITIYLAYSIIYNIYYKIKNYIYIVHIGIVFAIIAALLSNELNDELVATLKIGESIKLEDYTFTLRDVNVYQSSSYYSMYGSILIEDYNNVHTTFPEKRLYLFNNTVLTKSSILSNISTDIYCLLGDGSNDDGWYIRVYINPIISYLWLGLFITSIYSVVHIFTKYYTKIKYNNEISHNKG